MRLQDSTYSCGASAVQNALLALGISRSALELETLLGTSPVNGTSTRGLIKGLNQIDGCRPVTIREKRRDVALLRLRFALDAGRPVILTWRCTEPADHWVAAVGRLGERYLIADSADAELVLSLRVETLADQWSDGGTYLGVVL